MPTADFHKPATRVAQPVEKPVRHDAAVRSSVSFPIETARLSLRPFEPTDVAEIHPVFRQPEVWRFVGYPPCASLGDTRKRLARYAEVQDRYGFSFWAVRLRSTGRLIGDCGLAPLEWRGPEIEIGYRLGPAHWGQGLTTEAATACLRVGFEELCLKRIVGRAQPENVASRRVMEKIGLAYEGRGFHGGQESVVYGLSRAAWLSSPRLCGVITAVSRSAAHAVSKPNQDRIRLLAGLGVEGDAHMGATVKHRSRVARDPTQPNLRQVHLIHAELHDELRAAGFLVSAGQMGENITTRGIDLLALPAGTRLHLGDAAVVELTGLRNPCSQLDSIQPGLMAATVTRDEHGHLIRKAGVMGTILTAGEVRPGDPIRVQLPTQPLRPLEPV